MSFIDKLVKKTTDIIFSPTYDTLTMRYFEDNFYNICELKWGK